jgi:predicted histone-like DNA-binding protein
MPVKFNVIQKANPLKKNDPKKSYAVIKSDGEITLKQMSKRISSMSTVNSGDILAVLDLLVQVMQEEIAQGRIVRLGDFGSFALSLSSEGKEKDTDVNASTIKGAKLNFRPGKDIKNTLNTLDFEKA